MKQVLAAFIFFTRLPFWRLAEVSAGYFKRVVCYWPLTGWLTAGCSVLVLYISSLIVPYSIALLFAMVTRLLITGCLHEDGLADFLDGFGGGTTRERILSIMKDSHIGTYGVIGLLFYFALFYSLLNSLPLQVTICVWIAADPFSKTVSSMIINRLPYARPEQEAKNKTVYSPMNGKEYTISLLSGIIPLTVLPAYFYIAAILFPVSTWYIMTTLMKRKIGGYTGDCCGAIFLLCELSFIIGIVMIYNSQLIIYN